MLAGIWFRLAAVASIKRDRIRATYLTGRASGAPWLSLGSAGMAIGEKHTLQSVRLLKDPSLMRFYVFVVSMNVSIPCDERTASKQPSRFLRYGW